MRALTIAALTLTLGLFATAAHAEEKAKAPAAPASKVIILDTTHIALRVPRPHAVVDLSRLVPRAPLPELRKSLVDNIGNAVDKDPF